MTPPDAYGLPGNRYAFYDRARRHVGHYRGPPGSTRTRVHRKRETRDVRFAHKIRTDLYNFIVSGDATVAAVRCFSPASLKSKPSSANRERFQNQIPTSEKTEMCFFDFCRYRRRAIDKLVQNGRTKFVNRTFNPHTVRQQERLSVIFKRQSSFRRD